MLFLYGPHGITSITGSFSNNARVDFVRQADRFLLMELELIEPCLFFKFDAGVSERFSNCLRNKL